MSSDDLALIAAMRAFAQDPSGLCFSINGCRGSVAVFRDDIEPRTDQALIALLLERGASPAAEGWVYRSVHIVN